MDTLQHIDQPAQRPRRRPMSGPVRETHGRPGIAVMEKRRSGNAPASCDNQSKEFRSRGEQADCGEASLARRNNPKEFVSVRTAAKRARERVSLGLCSPERVTPLPT